MRLTRVLLLSLAVLGGLAVFWKFHTAPRSIAAVPTARTDVVAIGAAQTLAPESTFARQETLRRFAYAQGWDRAMPTALAAFREWTQRHLAGNAATRAILEAEGVALARARRGVMRELITSDPERALALTVPAVIRQQLPAAVLAELETRVAGRGEFTLVGATPAPGEPVPPSLRRIALIGGTQFTAHAYGRREPQTTLDGTSLHGIAIDRQLALHESPVRALEPGEIPAGAAAENCPVTDRAVDGLVADEPANLAAIEVAEADGRTWQFCSVGADMLDGFAQMLASREDNAGPRGNVTPPTAADAPTPWNTGVKQVLVIRVDFSDFPGEPMAQSAAQAVMANVNTLFQEMSYGQTSIVATVSNNVYRMPSTGASYAINDTEAQMHTEARAAAGADYNVASFDRIILLFRSLGTAAVPGSRITFAGEGQIIGPNVWINGSGSFTLATVSHELGHTYGLLHSNLWRVTDGNALSAGGTSLEYGDAFDIMGSTSVTGITRDSRHHFNMWHKNRLGWLPDAAVTTVTTSGTYRIYRFDHRDSPRQLPLALRIFRDGVRSYWVGLRQNFATGTPAANDAYVIWGYNTIQQSALLDLTTPGVSTTSSAASSGFDAALPIGATFTDPNYGITIKPTLRGGTEPNQFLELEVTVPASPPNVITSWGRNGATFVDGNGVPTSPTPETNVPMGLSGVRAIAGGDQHVVALKSDGTVAAWGDHVGGQTSVPAGLNSVVAVAAGGDVSGAVRSDGTVVMWGDNAFGQVTVPAGLNNVRQIAIGRNHVVALKTDGTVVAWGLNDLGQTTVPAGLNNVTAVTAGTALSVALKSDGTAVGWGSTFGRPPAGMNNLVAISSAGVLNGGQFVAGLKADGTVVAWGAPANNQVNVPAGLDNVVAISAGAVHTLCLKADGTVVTFGFDFSARLVPTNLPRSSAVAATNAGSFALSGPGLYITTAPAAQTVAAGASATLSVAVTGSGTVTYQWRKDGVAIPGATSSSLTVNSMSAANVGSYDVVVRDATTTRTTFGAQLSMAITAGSEISRISNLSILTSLASRTDTFRMGFVVVGAGPSTPKRLLIRAAGPSLGALGVPGTLGDPTVTLFTGTTQVGYNDDWQGQPLVTATMAAVGAFPYVSSAALDAALVADVAGRDNTVVVGSLAGGAPSGAVIAEIYDTTPASQFSADVPRLINVSVLKDLGANLTAGFVVAGPAGSTKRVLIRAVGPGLAAVGVTSGTVFDPRLTLFGAGQAQLGNNNDWGGTAELTAAFSAVGAFVIPATSRDAALVTTLAPGNYSVLVVPASGATGLALIEVYEVP
jgi:hypothetical protein